MAARNTGSQDDLDGVFDSLALSEQTVSTQGYKEGYIAGERKARRGALNVSLNITKFAARRRALEVLFQHTLNSLTAKEEDNRSGGLTASEIQLRAQLNNNLEVLQSLDYDVDRESKITRLIAAYSKVTGHKPNCLAIKNLVPAEMKSSPYQF